MFYNEILDKLLKEETNPVNKMYLHEIKIKWQNISKAINNSNGSNKAIVEKLNVFRKAINNKKYKFNKQNSKGFIDDSLLFSVNYLNDLISVIINRHKIINHKGIFWGCGSFNMNYNFSPKSFITLENNIQFEQSSSPEVLMLGQNIELNYRVRGKRSFDKYRSVLPLIVFHTFKSLGENDMLYLSYLAKLAKNSLSKSKTIILTEKLEGDFLPDLSKTSIDHVCILIEEDNKISEKVVDKFEALVKKIIEEKNVTFNSLKDKNIITRRR